MEEERKKLLQAARDAFCEVGLGGASLDSIALRAALSPPIARALFVDKETLFKTVLHEWTDPLISAIGVAVGEIQDPKELIRKSLRLLDQWLLENPQYIRLLKWSFLDEEKAISGIYEHSFYPSEFYERLETHVKSGDIRAKDVMTVLLLLDSLIFFPHMIRPALTLMSPNETDETIFERRLDAVTDLLDNGLFRA